MIRSLFSGVTGLRTHNQRMDVIGNNIANVNTTAFKGSTVTFRDVYYQTRQRASGGDFTAGGVNPMQTGLGVQLGTVSKVMTQSGITFSDSAFDLALEGSGFFQVMDPMGNIFYTRLGRFSLDDFGNLVDPNGNIVLGVTGDPTNIEASSQRINIMIPDIQDAQAEATSVFRAGGQDHNIVIRAGGIGPGGNIALTIIPSDFPFATMTGSTLNVFMDLSVDFEGNAIRDLLLDAGGAGATGPLAVRPRVMLDPITEAPIGTNRLTAAQAAVINEAMGVPGGVTGGDGTTTGDLVTAEHVALFNQAVIDRVSESFSVAVRDAIRLGGVNIDAALEEIRVDFVSTPDVTAAQNAGNWLQMPGTAPSAMGGTPVFINPLPTDATQNVLNDAQVAALRNHGFVPEIAAGTNPSVTQLHVDFFNAIVNRNTINFEVNQAGAAGNNIRIDMVVDTTPGNASVTAGWNGNVLTVRVPPTGTSIGALQTAIDNAAAGNPARSITVTNNAGPGGTELGGSSPVPGTPLTDLQIRTLQAAIAAAADAGNPFGFPPGATATLPLPVAATDDLRAVFNAYVRSANMAAHTGGIGANNTTPPRVGMTGGTNSFFEDAFSRLGTMPLTGGAVQTAQTADTADIFIDRDGVIYGMHPVHGQLILGRVDIVEFVNPAGLAQVGTSYFVETLASGPAQVRLARNESDTQIISGALEMSNIDLSQEFSDMIITQRGFQANSRIITVSDSMLEELVNLKR
jgi:flagellar hook-basal body protein